MVQDGTYVIDIGRQSTRHFSKTVNEQEEVNRVFPAIKLIRQHLATPTFIDSTKDEVARPAIEAGADIVTNISALRFDLNMAEFGNS